MLELKGKYTDAKIFIDNIEEGVFQQVYGIINSQISNGLKVRIMPDAHVGSGVCVGFSMELGKFLDVGLVGCDIGCGLLGVKFDKKNSINLEKLETQIRQSVPTGFNLHPSPIVNKIDFEEIQKIANSFIVNFNEKFGTSYDAPTYNDKWLTDKLKDIKMDASKFWNSIGTMGGSNHFIEVGKNLEGDYWITVHSGSRNLGIKIFDYWNNIAIGKVKVVSKEYTNDLDNIIQNTKIKSEIPKRIKELKEKHKVGIAKGYLSDDNLIGYIFDMIFTQYYAYVNRLTMLDIIKEKLNIDKYDEIVSTIHNYIDPYDMIIRKGAVKSYKEQKFLLPFNMRDGILLCEGKSNSDWNFSSPHGAGRLFSRSKAKVTVDYNEYKKSMKGIVTTSVTKNTLDESPQSYKSSKLIESLIQDTATVVDRITPVMNIKDKSEGMSWKERKNKKKKDQDRKRERRDKSYKNMKRM